MVDIWQQWESQITAVYRHGFLALLSDRDGIYVTNRDRSGPYTIYVENLDYWLTQIKPGQKITFDNKNIRILDTRLCINLSQANYWLIREIEGLARSDDIILNIYKSMDTAISVVGCRSEAYSTLYSMLLTEEFKGCPIKSPVTIRKYSQAFSILLYSIGIGNQELITNAARSLLGFGVGSTPSGDDVVMGLLATMKLTANYFGMEDEKQNRICNNILHQRSMRTNLLSSNLLWAASKGEVDDNLKQIIIKLAAASVIEKQDFENLGQVGYSSGFDGLSGVVISLLGLIKFSKFVSS